MQDKAMQAELRYGIEVIAYADNNSNRRMFSVVTRKCRPRIVDAHVFGVKR